MAPRVFPRLRRQSKSPPVTLPRPPDSEDIDRVNAEQNNGRDDWRGRRPETARELRLRHGQAVASALNKHDHAFLEEHAADARLMKEFEHRDPVDGSGTWHETPRTKLVEDSLWQNLVRERLKSYAHGMLPGPHDNEAEFNEHNIMSRRRLERLEEFVGETEYYLLQEKLNHRIFELDSQLQNEAHESAESAGGDSSEMLEGHMHEENRLDELLLLRHVFRSQVHNRLQAPPAATRGRPLPAHPLTDEAVKVAYRDAMAHIEGQGPDYHDVVDRYRLRTPASNARYWTLFMIHDLERDYQHEYRANPTRDVKRKHRLIVHEIAVEMAAHPPGNRNAAERILHASIAKIDAMHGRALEQAYAPLRRAQSLMRPPSVHGRPPSPGAASHHSEDTATDRSPSPLSYEDHEVVPRSHNPYAGEDPARVHTPFDHNDLLPSLEMGPGPTMYHDSDPVHQQGHSSFPGYESGEHSPHDASALHYPYRPPGPHGPREPGADLQAYAQAGRGHMRNRKPLPNVPTHAALASRASSLQRQRAGGVRDV